MENERINQLTFGELLKAYRKRKQLTQRHLATRLGIHYNTIYRWEQGDFLPDTRGIMLEMAKQLGLNGVETRYLLEASLTALSPHWSVPYQRNPFFTGREDLMQHLHGLLSNQEKRAIVQSYALNGLGGIGKTQIALEYAYRYAQEYSAVFWIDMETHESCVSSLEAISRCLGLPEQLEAAQDTPLATSTRWLSNHRNWLLILDNLEDLTLLKQILSGLRQGTILITTRLQALGMLAHSIEIELLTQDEGAQFLLRRIHHLKSHSSSSYVDEYKVARTLTETLGGLPLALDQAGAYIEETRCNIADFLYLFQKHPIQMLRERTAYSDHPLSVDETFSRDFDRLQCRNRVAAHLLMICCCLASCEITEELLIRSMPFLRKILPTMTSTPFELNAALRDLQIFAFIRRHRQTRAITLHRLLQVVLKERVPEAFQRDWMEYISQSPYLAGKEFCGPEPAINHSL